MAPRQAARDVEPEPGARHRPDRVLVEPHEALEDRLSLLEGDAHPVVGDRQAGRLGIPAAQRHRRRHRAVGEGVVDKVVEDPADVLGVGLDHQRLLAQLEREVGLEQQRARLGSLRRRPSGVAEVEDERSLGQRADVHPGRQEEVVDDPVQLVRLCAEHLERHLPRRRADPERALRHQRQVARDDRERRPQLVRGHVQELRLGARRLLRRHI